MEDGKQHEEEKGKAGERLLVKEKPNNARKKGTGGRGDRKRRVRGY